MYIGEGTYYGECCELSKTDESQTCTPETNNTLYVNKKMKIGVPGWLSGLSLCLWFRS